MSLAAAVTIAILLEPSGAERAALAASTPPVLSPGAWCVLGLGFVGLALARTGLRRRLR